MPWKVLPMRTMEKAILINGELNGYDKEGFNQIRKSPLENASEKEIFNYKFPFEHIEQLLKSMDKIIPFSKEYFIGCDISPCLLELLFRIRGMENTFLDILASPDISNRFTFESCCFCY